MFPDMILSVGVIFEDSFGGNPDAEDAANYTDPELTFEFVADSERDFDAIFPSSNSIPRVLVIDSRDMTIFYKADGHDKSALIAAVNDLLAQP